MKRFFRIYQSDLYIACLYYPHERGYMTCRSGADIVPDQTFDLLSGLFAEKFSRSRFVDNVYEMINFHNTV